MRNRFLFRHLPLLVVIYAVLSILHMECRSIPRHSDLAYTVVFPLFWIGLVLARLWMVTGRTAAAAGLRSALACLLVPILVILLPEIGCLRSVDTLKLVYEITAAVALLALAVHCVIYKGWKLFAIFFGAGALYGICLENGGILMGFFSEEGYRIYLRPVLPGPLFVALGWCTVFYCVVYCTDCITTVATPVWVRASVAVAIALCLDIQLDPFATRSDWWRWNTALPAWHDQVPLINYISWCCAMLPFAGHYFLMVQRQYHEKRRAKLTLACVPLYLAVGGALAVWTTMLLCGPSSPGMHLFFEAGWNILPGNM